MSAAVPSGARGRPSSPEAAGRWSRAKDGQQRARRTAVLLPPVSRFEVDVTGHYRTQGGVSRRPPAALRSALSRHRTGFAHHPR